MTEELVIMRDRQAVTTSLQVAENFEKEHKNVLQSIKNLVAENSATKDMFVEGTYVNRGKEYPMVYMNRDGFSLLAMGFTGKKSNAYRDKNVRAKTYRALFSSYRETFDQYRYNDLPMKDFDKAVDFVNNWYPPFELQQQIQMANAQLAIV